MSANTHTSRLDPDEQSDGDQSPPTGRAPDDRGGGADAAGSGQANRPDEGPEFESTVERVPRLSGAVWIALGLASVGIITREPVLVVGATIPLWYLAYGALTGMGAVEIEIERECPTVVDRPGDRVPVTLTVENVGDDPISDLRVVDGVPTDLAVVEGSPRTCVALGPGERATLEYELAAQRGTHRFDAPRVRVRNLVGTAVETGTVEAAGDDAVTCELPVESVPLNDRTALRAGRVPSDDGGSGIEFHAVREYQRGDPVRYIDWRRYARTGELTTVEYRNEQATIAGVVVDARPEMYVAPEEGAPDAAVTAAYAADRAVDRLTAAGYPTALFPVTDDGGGAIGPGRDAETAHRIRGRLAELQKADPDWTALYSDSWSALPSDVGEVVIDRLPGHATVLVVSPAIDDFPTNLCRGLARRGYDVTLVSPDIGDEEDPAQRVRHVQRRDRLVELRGDGVGVVDWDRDRPLATALETAIAGGDRR